MKYKICFILKAYFPSVSPSGLLIKKLAEELANYHDVHIVCRDLDEGINTDFYNQVKIYRYKSFNKANTMISKIFRTISLSFYNEKIVDEIMMNVNNYLLKNSFDFIIPVTYEEIVACSKLLEIGNNFYPFLLEKLFNKKYFGKFDLFYNIREKRNNKILALYKNKNCKFFCLPVVKQYLIDCTSLQEEDICVLEHPTVILDKKNSLNSIEKNNKIRITYVGALDTKIRNPKNFLQYLLPLFPKNYKVNFYGYGNCDSMLLLYEKKYSNFKYGGQINSEIALDILKKSDFLLTFGNSTPEVVSSKIFDCISTQNPIIHFYQYDTDPYINYLKGYPLSLCVPLNELASEKYQNEVMEFLKKNTHKRASSEQILKTYYKFTPAYVGESMIKYLEKRKLYVKKFN